MSEKHTPGRVTFREDGDANHWSMLTEDGRWLLAILHNGEAPSERQVANFRRLAAAWNACEGVPTEMLEKAPLDTVLKETVAQRDELLAAAKHVMEFIEAAHRPPVKDEFEFGRMVLVRLHALAHLHAAIAKVEGGAA